MRALTRVAAVCGWIAASTALAGKYNDALSIGDTAPEWSGLVGTDDQAHALSDVSDAKAVVVVFTCNHCPIAQAYEERLVEFAKEYQPEGVAVVAINVNNIEADKLPAMKERAAEKGFVFPYLYDPSQKVGRAYGATVTPHVFVLDGDRKVVYMGAFDDSRRETRVEEHFLKDAVDAVLAGKKPSVQETRQFGCSIKYD